MEVSNFKTSRGNKANNQLIIHTSEYTLFKSYNSIIIKTTFEDGVKVYYLDKRYWNYSKTTSRYRNEFLGETSKETLAKINNGTYKLVNLN